jgi:hypothetical protein
MYAAIIARTAFRTPADLKRKLQLLAKQEARSLSQICELLLKIGVEEYDREGHRHLQKMLSHVRADSSA